MRAQIIFQRAQKGTDQRAQGTDGAQMQKLICALRSICYYFSFLLKGTKAQNKYKPQDIIKKGIYRPKQGQKGTAKQNTAIWVLSVPCALDGFRGATA